MSVADLHAEIIASRWAVYRLADDKEAYGKDAGRVIVTTADYESEVTGPLDDVIAERIVYAHNACIDYVLAEPSGAQLVTQAREVLNPPVRSLEPLQFDLRHNRPSL